MVWPARAGILGQGRNAADGSLRHVAGDRGEAIDRAGTDPVGERVDQPRKIRLRRVDQAACSLPLCEGFRQRGGERHDLDAEAGIDGLDLVAEQPGEAF